MFVFTHGGGTPAKRPPFARCCGSVPQRVPPRPRAAGRRVRRPAHVTAARRLALGAAAAARPRVAHGRPRERGAAAARAASAQHRALARCARSVRRGRRVGRGARLLAAFPRTGGPLLVLSLDGRHIRAQETTLWMTRTRCARPGDAREAAPQAAAARARRDRPRRPRRPAARQARPAAHARRIYRTAGYQYGIDWRVLAAINRVETNFGRNTHVSSAGAVGWMQFLPSTWRRWGVDASGDGIADPYDPQDAIFSAARYLDAAGARTESAPRDLRLQPRRLVRQRDPLDRRRAARQLRRLRACSSASTLSASRAVEPAAHSARRARRPAEHASAALLARTPADGLGPAEALAGGSSSPESPSSAAVARPAARA